MRTLFPLLILLLFTSADPADPARSARWEKEIVAIEKRLKESPPKEGSVFFVGSSTIRLWDVRKSFPDVPTTNVGFGGSEIRDSTDFAPRIILPHKPKVIVFYAGDNDIASGRKPEQVAADFNAFCRVIHKESPQSRILFLAIKPSLARWKQFDEQKRANALVKDICGANDRLAFVDVVPLFLGPDGAPVPELYAKDGLHLSPAGYEKWTPMIAPLLGK